MSDNSTRRFQLVPIEYQLKQKRRGYYKSRSTPSWTEYLDCYALNIFAAAGLLLIALILYIKRRDKEANVHREVPRRYTNVSASSAAA